MNPQIQDYNIQSSRATYTPVLTGTFGQNHSSVPNTDATLVVDSSVSASQSYNAALSQNVQFYGGSYSANWTSSRATNNLPTQLRNPNMSASTRINYTQPLMANFKIDANRTTLKTQAIQKQMVDIQLQQTIENTRANVRTAYWNLRQAIESIEIQKRSLELSRRQFEDNKTKVEIGTMAPIDTCRTNRRSPPPSRPC